MVTLKHFIYFVLIFFLADACVEAPKSTPKQMPSDKGPYSYIKGKTMGTTYSIVHHNPELLDLKASIDSVLVDFNMEVSTYIPAATISRFNTQNEITVAKESYFHKNIILAKKLWQETGGYFDPTVMPLVNYYGFGYKPKSASINLDSIQVLMNLVGFEKMEMTEKQDSIVLKKQYDKSALDFSAIAKGYGVDVVGLFLESKGITDYLVEIGGETYVRGLSPKKRKWILGINTPEVQASTRDMFTQIDVTDIAVATSGNYRNFYEENGQKFTHTISPKTGQTIQSALLSATILASDCATADALATACMAMGLEKAKNFVTDKQIAAYFIYNNQNELAEFVSAKMQPYFSTQQ